MGKPQALQADRRLYETADRDAVVEHGDPRGRWLLAGVGSQIGASDVEKYGLKSRNGRLTYNGCPDLPRLTVGELKELGRHDDKMVRAHEDKAFVARHGMTREEKEAADEEAAAEEERRRRAARTGLRIDTLEDQEAAETAAAAEEAGEEDEGGAADHSDRNEAEESSGSEAEEPLPDWPMSRTPESYLAQYPTGPNAELARRHVAAAAEGDGGS